MLQYRFLFWEPLLSLVRRLTGTDDKTPLIDVAVIDHSGNFQLQISY